MLNYQLQISKKNILSKSKEEFKSLRKIHNIAAMNLCILFYKLLINIYIKATVTQRTKICITKLFYIFLINACDMICYLQSVSYVILVILHLKNLLFAKNREIF